MSKIAFVTDFHFGVHSESQEFLDYQKKFFDSVFFPYLEENGIKDIISLGDEFHSRKNINYNTLHQAKEMFFDRIEYEGYKLHVIIGNHNIFFKDHNDVNSPSLLFHKYKNINIIETPLEIVYDSCKLLLVPWINKNNEQEILEAINNTNAEYLLGHFEIQGMTLHKNWQFHKGLNHSIVDKFKEVWSGHYHLKLNKNNFHYLGTGFQLDWSDVNHAKGFYIFDTINKKLQFIENPLKIYHIINYEESINIEEFNYFKYSKSFTRVLINENIKAFDKFDMFIKKLEEVCFQVKIVEKYFENIENSGNKTDLEKDNETTLDTIKRMCKDIEIVDNDKLFKFMNNIYIKSKDLMSL